MLKWLVVVGPWLVAIGVPLFFVFVRNQARLQRLQILSQLKTIMSRRGKGEGAVDALSRLSSFEYVKEKYTSDLGEAARYAEADSPIILKAAAHWWAIGSSWRILLASVPFMVMCGIGFVLMLKCANGPDTLAVCPDCLWLTGGETPKVSLDLQAHNVLTVAVAAFLGAYLFSLNILSRAVAVFDLSTVTMMRVSVNMVVAVIGAVIVYRALPNPGYLIVELVDLDKIMVPPPGPLPPGWLIIAFAFGLIPDLAVNQVIVKVQGWSGSKTTDGDLVRLTRSTSLEILDGVDLFVRFRMQQANIFEMQNLAVANPVMLFIETPYGLYQCVDWVAQAQLCTVVGPERFLALRRYNIRTIFDLERAMLGTNTTSQFRRLIGSLIMTAPSDSGPEAARPARFRLICGKGEAAVDQVIVGSDDFLAQVNALLSEPAKDEMGQLIADDPERTLKHLTAIIIDDLHIHRLRGVWMAVCASLGEAAAYLPDNVLRPPPSPSKAETSA